MSNINITGKRNIKEVITEIFGSFDTDATYQIQNTGNSNMSFETIINKDVANSQTFLLQPSAIALFKSKENEEIFAFSNGGVGGFIAINKQ